MKDLQKGMQIMNSNPSEIGFGVKYDLKDDNFKKMRM